MSFKCEKCPYTSDYKQNLLRHTCKLSKNLKFKCPTEDCEYSSNRKFCLESHQINCKKHNSSNIIIDNSINTITDNSITDNSITDNSITDNSINNININILMPWDDPLIGFALEKGLQEYLDGVNVNKVSAKEIMNDVIRKIYFNPNHPENHSIKIDNQRKGTVTVYTREDKFESKKISDIKDKVTGVAICKTEYYADEKKFPDKLIGEMGNISVKQLNHVISENKQMIKETHNIIEKQGPVSVADFNKMASKISNDIDTNKYIAERAANKKIKAYLEKQNFIRNSFVKKKYVYIEDDSFESLGLDFNIELIESKKKLAIEKERRIQIRGQE